MLNEIIGKTGPGVWPRGRVIWLLVLAAVFLAPAIRTSYWAEDLYQSVMPRGFTVIDDKPLTAVIGEHVLHTISNGRFFPLTPVLITTVHYLCHEAWVYKAYIVVVGLLDILLFYRLASELSGRRDYGCFAACLTVGLLQYRVAIDPSLGFFGQMQWLIAALFLSLLALRRYLEGRGRRWLVASVVLYFACTLMYEVSYTLVFLHVCLIFQAVESPFKRIRTSLPFFAAVGFCGVSTIVVRRLYPTEAYWHKPDIDLGAVALAVVHQVSAGLPLSYFAFDPLEIFPGPGRKGLVRWLLNGQMFLLALPAFGLCLLCLRPRMASPEPRSKGVGRWCLAALGLILAIFPTILISISPYHRASLSPGVGWIPVLIQVYGVGLLFSAILWKFTESTVGGGSKALWKCVTVSVLVGGIVGVTYRANREVVRCFNSVPGSRNYRDVVGRAGGAWNEQRKLLESALSSGLLDEIPEHSTVVIAREYPFWYDTTYSRYFYAAHSGKSFVTLPPAEEPTHPEAYRVRDVLLGNDSGYVVLSRKAQGASIDGDPAGSGGLRLYIRHPNLFRRDARIPFQITTQEATSSGQDRVIAFQDLREIKSGSDWAIYSLETPGKILPPDSLQVVLNRPR